MLCVIEMCGNCEIFCLLMLFRKGMKGLLLLWMCSSGMGVLMVLGGIFSIVLIIVIVLNSLGVLVVM